MEKKLWEDHIVRSCGRNCLITNLFPSIQLVIMHQMYKQKHEVFILILDKKNIFHKLANWKAKMALAQYFLLQLIVAFDVLIELCCMCSSPVICQFPGGDHRAWWVSLMEHLTILFGTSIYQNEKSCSYMGHSNREIIAHDLKLPGRVLRHRPYSYRYTEWCNNIIRT